MKTFYRYLLISLALVLSACNSNLRDGRIGSLGQPAALQDDAEQDVSPVEEPTVVADYARFIRLFDTFSSETMRRDGMRRMAGLQLQYSGDEKIPLPAVIQLFEQLIEDHPLERHDRLMYQLSREYEESGDLDAALTSLDRMVKLYPDSKFYDEAQFRRGEILFSMRQYQAAEQAYSQVIAFRKYDDKSIYYEQAVYKQGWSQFKQSKYNEALNSFLHLLDLHTHEGDLKLDSMKPSERQFVEDAMRAINLSFSYQAGPVSARDYFAGQHRRVYEYRIYSSLADFYLQKKHYADSVKTYRLFVAANDMHPQSPAFLLKVIDVYERSGFPDLLIEAKKDYVQRYSIKSPFWGLYETSAHRTELQALNDNLKQLASYYHEEAQKNKRSLSYREAQRWYRTWLDSFADEEDAWHMNFLFAEILNESQQYEAAVSQYERTAYDYKRHEKSAEAGYAALLMYAKHEKILKGFSQQQWHRRSIESAIRFANTFTEHKQADRVLTQAIENLYELGEYQKAHQIALQASTDSIKPELLASIWTVMAHIEFEWKDFVSAETSYSRALDLIPQQQSSREALIKKKAVAVYKQGEISRKQGDLQSAVKHFSRVKQVSDEAGLVANAEYDAAAALIGLRKWADAASVLEGFRRANPNHALQAEVTRKLALVYLENAQIDKASIEYEKVSYLPADKTLQLESLWQSAELAEQAADSVRSKKLYKSFVSRFPQPLERSIEARQRLIELYQRDNKLKQADYWRLDLINSDAKAGQQRNDRTRYLAAKASFDLAEPTFERYRKVKLTVPLKKSLGLKRRRMDEALKLYTRAAAYKIPEVLTASTYRIAEVYQDLGVAIYNSERPKQLSQEELEQYDVLLEEKAYPFEEKAIEFHEINISRLAEGLDIVWIWKSLEQLRELLPVRYNKQEKSDSLVTTIF